MGTLEVVPRIQQLSLQSPRLPDRQETRSFVESCDIGPEPYPFVFAVTSSWFSAGKPLIKGWTGIGVDTKEGALVVVDLMEIVAYWEGAAKKSAQLQLQYVATALRRTDALQANPLAQGLREAGCIIMDAAWKKHCAAMYDLLFIQNQAPTPAGNLELLVLAGNLFAFHLCVVICLLVCRQGMEKLSGCRTTPNHAQNTTPF